MKFWLSETAKTMNSRKFQLDKGLPGVGGAGTRDNLAQGAAGRKPKLLGQVRELLRAKYYSIRTEEVYRLDSPIHFVL